MPRDPTVPEADWRCVNCESPYSMEYVSEALLNAEESLKKSDEKEDIIQHYERYIPTAENKIQVTDKGLLGLIQSNW